MDNIDNAKLGGVLFRVGDVINIEQDNGISQAVIVFSTKHIITKIPFKAHLLRHTIISATFQNGLRQDSSLLLEKTETIELKHYFKGEKFLIRKVGELNSAEKDIVADAFSSYLAPWYKELSKDKHVCKAYMTMIDGSKAMYYTLNSSVIRANSYGPIKLKGIDTTKDIDRIYDAKWRFKYYNQNIESLRSLLFSFVTNSRFVPKNSEEYRSHYTKISRTLLKIFETMGSTAMITAKHMKLYIHYLRSTQCKEQYDIDSLIYSCRINDRLHVKKAVEFIYYCHIYLKNLYLKAPIPKSPISTDRHIKVPWIILPKVWLLKI